MPIKLSLKEKCYIIALFGDIPESARGRLFMVSSFPPQAGPLVMQAGYDFVAGLKNRRIIERPRGRTRGATWRDKTAKGTGS